MFTGLIEKLGSIQDIHEQDGYRRLTLALAQADNFVQNLGASIAINGCCLTVTQFTPSSLSFDLSHETLAKTSLSSLKRDSLINLERALKVGDRLDGHMVAGHVDCTGRIQQVERLSGGWNIWLELPLEYARYVIAKGSIALDGISLTINEVKDEAAYCAIRLTLIPATVSHTNAQSWTEGSIINIEVDLVGKYFERLAQPHLHGIKKV